MYVCMYVILQVGYSRKLLSVCVCVCVCVCFGRLIILFVATMLRCGVVRCGVVQCRALYHIEWNEMSTWEKWRGGGGGWMDGWMER